jgi:hypothetical protein
LFDADFGAELANRQFAVVEEFDDGDSRGVRKRLENASFVPSNGVEHRRES